ncbi:hypothetical protein H4R24_001083 [Coemansia sp. RSA 988]|nr:hypothetical protein H4R24_001083 [Coemansia sp. RSA 988]
MARKLKSSNAESVNGGGAEDAVGQQAVTMPSPSPSPGPAASDGGAGAEAIQRRVRALRKKLQRVEAAENRKASQEAAGNANQESAAPSKATMLRAVVKELEELGQSIGSSAATVAAGVKTGNEGPRIGHGGAQKRRDGEVSVGVQTLRLAYAATDGLAKYGALCISDSEQCKLAEFYGMLLAGVGIGATDEKLSLAPAATAKHLRLLALREVATVIGMEEATDYAELSGIVDRVLECANGGYGGDKATQLASVAPDVRAANSQAVIMPELKCMAIQSDGSDAEDGNFNGHVVMPPGGISFIASADIAEGTDSEEADENEVAADAAVEESQRSAPVEVSSGVVMPLPVEVGDSSGIAEKHVGGFAHPFPANGQATAAVPNEGGESVGAADNSQSNGTAIATLAPTDSHPRENGVTVPPPVGFGGYGAPPTGIMPNWTTTTAPAGAGAVASPISGVPGGFGMMPMLYPPHLAMQYGYLPPHMYNMPGVNAAGVGANPPHSVQTPPMGGDAPAVVAVEPAAQRAPPPAGAGPGPGPGAAHGEMWGADAKGAVASVAGGEEAVLGGHPPPMGSTRALDGVPAPPMMLSMPSSDPYQQAMAMAAATAGFAMNAPFMYPHIDASNLSTAATGGSENNDSVNSIDTPSNRGGSNRGGSSRPDSMHVQQQQVPPAQAQQQHMQPVQSQPQVADPVQSQPQVADVGSRGFVQPAAPEYPPATQYMWPQPQPQPQADHSKNMAQGMYNYMYQQPQHPYYHGHQGYKQRGSGGSSSSNSGGSGGQHHSQPRERRGNPGYHRQQRWSNSNGHHYNRQSHSSNTATTAAPPAGASTHHGNSGSAQEGHDNNNASFSGVGNWQ